MQKTSNNHAIGTLNEGVVDTLKQLYQSLASKVAAIPDFKKYYNLAKSKQQETIEAIKTSASPAELKQKIASIASGVTVTEASVAAPAAAAGLAAAAGVFDIWAAQVVGVYSTAISYAAAGQTGMAVAGGVLFGVLGQLGCIGLALYFASKAAAASRTNAKNTELTELSVDLLGKYKSAASKAASAADAAGDFAQGNKRFKGIVTATKKQFAADAATAVKENAPVVTPTVNFTPAMIGTLKSRYNSITTIDPAGPTYKQLIKLLDSLGNAALQQLSTADIKFVSALAKNRIKK